MAIRLKCITEKVNRELWQLQRLTGQSVTHWNLEPPLAPVGQFVSRVSRCLTLALAPGPGSSSAPISSLVPLALALLVGFANLFIGLGFHVKKRARLLDVDERGGETPVVELPMGL